MLMADSDSSPQINNSACTTAQQFRASFKILFTFVGAPNQHLRFPEGSPAPKRFECCPIPPRPLDPESQVFILRVSMLHRGHETELPGVNKIFEGRDKSLDEAEKILISTSELSGLSIERTRQTTSTPRPTIVDPVEGLNLTFLVKASTNQDFHKIMERVSRQATVDILYVMGQDEADDHQPQQDASGGSAVPIEAVRSPATTEDQACWLQSVKVQVELILTKRSSDFANISQALLHVMHQPFNNGRTASVNKKCFSSYAFEDVQNELAEQGYVKYELFGKFGADLHKDNLWSFGRLCALNSGLLPPHQFRQLENETDVAMILALTTLASRTREEGRKKANLKGYSGW
ncbi:hypothetical protein I302_106568 [Kwoniella bestiolae CBS 10118]|uniref:Uncharacterized protein n=1 Tax=Kwoniella bestiolae CBS 10118 TaxID=1296100 RepID=A0AAJ8KBY4_9TREE